MSFLEGYEDVNARITRFRTEFPTGRLVAYIEDMNIDKGYILVKAEAYREYEDLIPSAIDYAFEAKSDRGVNLHFWVENCVTSAYGRVIGLLTPSTTRSTAQDMEKVERLQANDRLPAPSKPVSDDLWTTFPSFKTREEAESAGVPTVASAVSEVAAKLGGFISEESPQCQHGHMLLKEGVSDKTGKPYRGHVCIEKVKARQCPPIWYVQANGRWVKQ